MLTVERLREVLHYEPSTGVFTWLCRRGRAVAGARAGTIHRTGYRQIHLDGRLYRSGRLATFYMTGEWPVNEVDHKNGVRGDDSWDNLRPASRSQNGANTRIRSDNSSGFKGVTWDKRCGRWHARAYVRGKQIFLGYFDDPELAHNAYVTASNIHHGEFARTA